MTTEERIAIIRDKANRQKQAEIEKANSEHTERLALRKEVATLTDRIQDIIALANECELNDIKIPRDIHYRCAAKKYGYDAEFIAEGINHHTGLYHPWGERQKGKYNYLAIDNGGACGKWDFLTNGDISISVYEDDHSKTDEPRIYDMKKFINEFPVFETAFYNWIDSLQQ